METTHQLTHQINLEWFVLFTINDKQTTWIQIEI